MDAGKSVEFVIVEKADCVSAEQSARRMALAEGFPVETSEEIVIAVAELSTNVIKHAGRGVLMLRPLGGDRGGIEIEAEDHGPVSRTWRNVLQMATQPQEVWATGLAQ